MRKPQPLALLLAASLAFSPAVLAQSAQDRATARMLAQEADKKAAAKQYQEALDLFIKADALVPAPTLKMEIARLRAQLGQLVEAQQLMLDVSRSQPQPGEPASWAKARGEARAEADAITPKLASLELKIEGLPADRPPKVTIDGESINPSSLGVPRVMNPGKHSVKVEAAGFVSATRDVELTEGQKAQLSVPLERDPKAAAVHPAPGPSATATATGAPTQAPTSAPPGEAPSGHYGLAIAGFVVAGLGVAVGTGAGLVSKGKVDDLKTKCPSNRCDPSLKSDADSARTIGNISTGAFVLGGVGLAVGVIGLVIGKPSSNERGASIGVGPGSVTLSGRF